MKLALLSSSQKLPELRLQKILITEPDDKGFAKDQYDKIVQRIYTQKQLQLKPWEKDLNNIYSISGRTNHQILQNIKMKIRSKTIDMDDNSNNDFYNKDQLNTINNSIRLSKQIQINSKLRKKIKLPLASLKSYILETKQICKNKLISDIVKKEQDKIFKKQIEYDRALKHEIKTLNRDILQFELYTTNEMFERNQKFKYFSNIENKKKNLMEEIKELSQEYHTLKANIQKVLRFINEKKIYVNFVHKLLGGESKLENFNLDGINIQRMKQAELHVLVNKIQNEMDKNNIEDNIFITASDEELMENINKMDIVFKIMEEKILKTLSNKEKLRYELITLKKNQQIIIDDLNLKISEAEKEYQEIMKEYLEEKDNANFKSHSPEDYNYFIRNLLIDFYQYINPGLIKNIEDIDEYNIIDKIVKPAISYIKEKEKKIENFHINLENYNEEEPEIFNKSINKIKNENKLNKYIREKDNKEVSLKLMNSKIMEKYNKIFVKERNKYKMLEPLSIFKKNKNTVKELKTESNDYKLIYY